MASSTKQTTTDSKSPEEILRQIAKGDTERHLRMIRTVLDDGTVIVGKNKYDSLIQIHQSNRSKQQQTDIRNFENYHGITAYKAKHIEYLKAHEEKLKADEDRLKNLDITTESVWKVFKKKYFEVNQQAFEETADTRKNMASLVRYFAKDAEFLNYGYQLEGKYLSTPSLDKGLILVGGYGNGKSTVMKTFQKMFIGIPNYSFGYFSSHEIVTKYEQAVRTNNPEVLEKFWNMLTRSTLYIDDVKAESDALVFGKKNLINILLQERYNKGLKTHLTFNYMDGYNGNVDMALKEFKIKYSNQVYDRLFEMCNVIEFLGKSFRR